jgi:uncharacterized DUF497 family protein
MKFRYDPVKSAWNMRERALLFDDVALLDRESAIIRRDIR